MEKANSQNVTEIKRDKTVRDNAFVLWFDELRRQDVDLVGGKSSSLGELTSQTHVPVPYGYATTSEAYRYFMKETGCDKKANELLATLKDVEDSDELHEVCLKIRQAIVKAPMPESLAYIIGKSYDDLASMSNQAVQLMAKLQEDRELDLKLLKEVQKLNELFSSLLKEIYANEDLTEALNKKTIAISNFLWQSIIILAERIHDFTDKRN